MAAGSGTETSSGKKAKSKPCTEEPSGTKAKKPSGAVLATLEDHLGVKLKKIRIHTGGNNDYEMHMGDGLTVDAQLRHWVKAAMTETLSFDTRSAHTA